MSTRRYLDKTGLEEVALHVNSRLKTVTTMPVTADEGAVRLYVGQTTSSFIKGHTYQMRTTLEQRLKFQADEYTYYMTEAGDITTTAPASYSPQVEDVPTVDEATGATIVYMAGNNALVQRIGDEVSTITVDFNKIKSHVVPWWTAGAATGSYNPYTVRNVTLISLTEWVDITPSGSIITAASSADLLTAWTQMDEDSTAIVDVTTAFALNDDYDIPVGRHFLLKGSNADKTTLWTNDGRIFSATLEASVLVWTELHDDSKLSKVNELPLNPSVGDTVLYNGTTGTETEGHVYKYKDLTEHFTGAEVDGAFYDMNGNAISTPTDPEYSTSITVSAGGYELYVDNTAGKLFAKKTEDDTTYSVTINNDGTFTAGDSYTPESSVAAVAGNIATWSVEEFGWVDLESVPDASRIEYDNTESALTADNVQDAIDEVNDRVSSLPSAFIPKGTVAFESLPALTDAQIGWTYNVSNGFTTTSDFVEGVGKVYTAGQNVAVVEPEEGVKKWDVFSGELNDFETSWTGTRAEWEALTSEVQSKYKIVNFTDDTAEGGAVVVDAVENGNLNPVTSNAVALAIGGIITPASVSRTGAVASGWIPITLPAGVTSAKIIAGSKAGKAPVAATGDCYLNHEISVDSDANSIWAIPIGDFNTAFPTMNITDGDVAIIKIELTY